MQLFDAAAPERPVILVLSDGNNVDPLGTASVTHVIDRAQRSGVMIYSVGVHGRPTVALPMVDLFNANDIRGNAPHPDLRRVADETGGGYLEVSKSDDLAGAFAQVADELHSQYLLGYVPPKSDGKLHKIGVRLKVSGMRARARKTYVAPSSASGGSGPQ
jgi:VWFA-related protein